MMIYKDLQGNILTIAQVQKIVDDKLKGTDTRGVVMNTGIVYFQIEPVAND